MILTESFKIKFKQIKYETNLSLAVSEDELDCGQAIKRKELRKRREGKQDSSFLKIFFQFFFITDSHTRQENQYRR
jgi:hypothetical protein